MIKNKHLDQVIEDMNKDGHVMEAGTYLHKKGTYKYKIQKVKENTS